MASRTYIAATALVAATLLAPNAAHALTATSPVQSAVTIQSTNTPIGFQGFSNIFKTANSIPLTAILNSVMITVKGTSGGNVVVTQFSPLNTATVTSPGKLNLTVNGIMPVAQDNASSSTPSIIPAATLTPTYTPGVGTITVVPQPHTYTWTLTPGGTNDISYFYNNAVTLQALSEFAPVIVGAGASETSDSTTFALDSTLANTYLTFDYTIPAPGAATPGPLPLLGAASAFGFSRRLRRRIKLVA